MRIGDLDALKEELKQYFSDGVLDSVSAKLAFNMILRKIDEAPTVAEDYSTGYQDGLEDGLNDIRPQGAWIAGENGNIKCNQCGAEIRYSYLIGNKPDFPKFCCDCGADMRKGGVE